MNKEKHTDGVFSWDYLDYLINSNIAYSKSENYKSSNLHDSLFGILNQINEGRSLYDEISSFCKEYDVDETIQANGYRSFLKIFDSAINHVFKNLKYFTENRSRILFRKSQCIKEIDACHQLLTALNDSFKQLLSIHLSSENGNLFSFNKYSPIDVLKQASEINQSAFYGRCLGIQYYDSIKSILKFISISMACYSESYYNNNNNKLLKTPNSIYNSGKYFFDPEVLANRIVDLSRNASIDFCKNFWCLTESEIIYSIPFVNHSVKVNRLIKLNPNPIQIQTVKSHRLIDVQAPGLIQARLISMCKRTGMIGEKEKNSGDIFPKSKEILFHCHGGGFVAQSSKSHLVYLLEWAVNLNVPIISIDYSLAPEYPYPYAANEIFYAYCWVLKNCELLGWTGEKIVFCGDSAGANLCLSTLIRCISLDIRKPNGIFAAYCPILVSFDPSPSRLLYLQDPLIPIGFLLRCLKAYASSSQADDKSKDEDLDEKDLLKSDNDLDISSVSNRSDSFEEISCFECHQTDSDMKAHISQVSGASNDTLEINTSLLTVTEKQKEIVDSPADSINSGISLEKDSFNVEEIFDNNSEKILVTKIIEPSVSETNTSTTYVNEFIEKYAVDDNVLLKPHHNRRVSRTRSEENIIFDVSKEAFCTRNLHSKFRYAASSFAKTFSTTIDEITKNNHIISKTFQQQEDCPNEHIFNDDFIFAVPKDPLLSPFYVSDEILSQFPPTKLLSLTLDACLDDSVMFAKRLKALNVCFTFDVLDKLPHGFLNFTRLSKEAHEGSKLSMLRIAELLDLKLNLA